MVDESVLVESEGQNNEVGRFYRDVEQRGKEILAKLPRVNEADLLRDGVDKYDFVGSGQDGVVFRDDEGSCIKLTKGGEEGLAFRLSNQVVQIQSEDKHGQWVTTRSGETRRLKSPWSDRTDVYKPEDEAEAMIRARLVDEHIPEVKRLIVGPDGKCIGYEREHKEGRLELLTHAPEMNDRIGKLGEVGVYVDNAGAASSSVIVDEDGNKWLVDLGLE